MSRPRSRPSSVTASPLSTPRADGGNSPSSPFSSPGSPNSSKAAAAPNKSIWPEKVKSLHLRLPSLSRSRSRSKREMATSSGEPSPSPVSVLRSPLRKSGSGKALLDSDRARHRGASSSLHGSSSMVPSGSASDLQFVEEITHVFETFDTNGDGKISAEELACMLRKLGDKTTEEEAELMVAEVDADKDGFIDLQEFIDLNAHMQAARGSGVGGSGRADGAAAADVTEELAAAFDMFDLDKNGCITADELHCVLGNLGNRTSTLEDCRRMIRGVDRKGSGHVDFDDFKVMMTTNATVMAGGPP